MSRSYKSSQRGRKELITSILLRTAIIQMIFYPPSSDVALEFDIYANLTNSEQILAYATPLSGLVTRADSVMMSDGVDIPNNAFNFVIYSIFLLVSINIMQRLIIHYLVLSEREFIMTAWPKLWSSL